MGKDGFAGDELADEEIGEICYHHPIVFLGYYNKPEETKKAVSEEGILYTGDLGYFKQMDGYKALYLSGRKKFIIKQKEYKIFLGPEIFINSSGTNPCPLTYFADIHPVKIII